MNENTPICPSCGAENSWKPVGLNFMYAVVIVILSMLLLLLGVAFINTQLEPIAYFVLGITPTASILAGICLSFNHRCCICGTWEHPTTEAWRAGASDSMISKLLKVKCPSCGISHMATRKQFETPIQCAQCGQVVALEEA